MSELTISRETSAKSAPSAELLDKLQAVGKELREEAGGIALFGLFEREDTPGQWDLLIAADWIGPDVTPAVAYIARKIQQRLAPDDLLLLAGVVALRSSDPAVKQLLTGTIRVEGCALLENCRFNGLLITRAWIFTAGIDRHSSFQPPPYLLHPEVGAKPKKAEQQTVTKAKSTQRKR
jgi:hypothetical protein